MTLPAAWPRPLDTAGFDYDGTRFCLPITNGVACYRGGAEGSNWNGRLVGIVDTTDDARRFLDGFPVSMRPQ